MDAKRVKQRKKEENKKKGCLQFLKQMSGTQNARHILDDISFHWKYNIHFLPLGKSSPKTPLHDSILM